MSTFQNFYASMLFVCLVFVLLVMRLPGMGECACKVELPCIHRGIYSIRPLDCKTVGAAGLLSGTRLY